MSGEIKNAQEVIAKTIELLDKYKEFYKKISGNRYDNYEEYITKGKFVDEERLVRPEFLRDFTQLILEFNTGTLSYQDPDNPSGDKPDAVPFDTRVHPFLFETKGSDSQDLSKHFNQLKRYIDSYGVTWGVIFNLRDCSVYSTPTNYPNIDLNFSFLDLYRRYRAYQRKEIKSYLEYDNTRAFLSFVKRFSKKEVSQIDKIQKIAEARKWTGLEVLDINILTNEIREVVKILHDDVKTRRLEIGKILGLNPERKEKVSLEIDDIAEDIDPKKPKREITKESLSTFLKAKFGTLDYQAVDSYLYRVAYFTMTKILLVRAWEDIGFIDQALFNGGFEEWYEKFNHEIDRVLRQAFHFAGERYSWLFNIENNYTWYTPSDDALIEVLYKFSNFNFSLLSTDVLGYVYEEYLDITDRKNKGQYYTPREIIRFIWDRVGFAGDDSIFRLERGKRNPRFIYDPATGSGGFLVEAIRRIRQDSHYNKKDFNELVKIFLAIVSGIYGSEIQAFPYYITEVNLLLQLTPVVKEMLDIKPSYFQRDWAIQVIQQDSLKLHNPSQPTLAGLGDAFKSKDEVYEKDKNHDIIHFEGLKLTAYEFIKNHQDFDYVCANPPYIGEKGHKELFRDTINNFPYWKRLYQGKMDYLYFFIELGLSKLRSGGKLGFITTAYWPTADGASKLRRHILDNAKIKEVIFFGELKLFEYAKGQHNMVFVLEKCGDQKAREENKIKIVTVKKEPEGKTVRERLKKLVNLINKNIARKNYSDEYIDVFVTPFEQGVLNESSWSLQVEREEGKIIKKICQIKSKLSDFCSIDQGVVPNPLRLTNEKLKAIPQNIVEKSNLKIGDGVFVLKKDELENLKLPEMEKSIIKPYFKNSDINRFITKTKTNNYLIYITAKTKIDEYTTIRTHLDKFRTFLSQRRECEEGKIPWFSLHWSREPRIFEGTKIVCSYRTERAAFAYHEGSFYGSTDMYFLKIKNEENPHSLKYLTGLLNSRLVDFYLANEGKMKGSVKEQFVTPLQEIPIPKINFSNSQAKGLYNNICYLVDEIIKLKHAIIKYQTYYPDNSLLDLESTDTLRSINNQKIVNNFLFKSSYSLRTDSRLKIEPQSIKNFFFNKIDKKGILQPDLSNRNLLRLISKNKQAISITGPIKNLEYLAEVLGDYQGDSWEEIKNKILIPKDFKELENTKKEIVTKVITLIKQINNIQNKIDENVYKLYQLTQDEIKMVQGLSKQQ